ncbi:hypothetical protein [Nonomuraea terrae]|nr:hypothetical protein [Nonomuraea terrae]
MDDNDTLHRRSDIRAGDSPWALGVPAARAADRPGTFRSRL